jgi:hypothetical protein
LRKPLLKYSVSRKLVERFVPASNSLKITDYVNVRPNSLVRDPRDIRLRLVLEDETRFYHFAIDFDADFMIN